MDKLILSSGYTITVQDVGTEGIAIIGDDGISYQLLIGLDLDSLDAFGSLITDEAKRIRAERVEDVKQQLAADVEAGQA